MGEKGLRFLARKPTAMCVFCEEEPCTCLHSSTKRQTSRRPKSSVESTSTEDANQAKPLQPSGPKKPPAFKRRSRASFASGTKIPIAPPVESTPFTQTKSPSSSENLFRPETLVRSSFKVSERVKSQDELEMEAAIRNLWPLLSESEQRKHKYLMETPLTAEQNRRKAEIRSNLHATD